MSSQNAVNDNGAQNKSLLAVDDTATTETRIIQTKIVGGKNHLLVTPDTTAIVTVDTELPAATALADGVSSTNIEPRVAADMQGLRADGTANSDRAVLGAMIDGDSTGSTKWTAAVILTTPGSGGPTQVGTSSAPLRTDPTGSTTQPVSGTIQPGNTQNTTPWLVSDYPGGTASGFAPSNYKDAGSVTKASVKASTGNVFSLRVTNANAAVRYFQIHNKATAPAATDVPIRYFIIPAGTAAQPAILELDKNYFNQAINCSTGIGWAISTTATPFTDAATAGEHTYDLNYQ